MLGSRYQIQHFHDILIVNSVGVLLGFYGTSSLARFDRLVFRHPYRSGDFRFIPSGVIKSVYKQPAYSFNSCRSSSLIEMAPASMIGQTVFIT
jgi:hypothetical protein